MDQSLFGFGTLMTCRRRPPLSVSIAGCWLFGSPFKVHMKMFIF